MARQRARTEALCGADDCAAFRGRSADGGYAFRAAAPPGIVRYRAAFGGDFRANQRYAPLLPLPFALSGDFDSRFRAAGDLRRARGHQGRARQDRQTPQNQPYHALSQNETIQTGLRIALDATYSVGDALSGVGLYSREILSGLAAAHPEARFDFCYRPHRYLRSRDLPANARRRLLLGPRSADLFHGLNQRLPRIWRGRAIATFHDLFVMTGEYSTPEFRARFTAQAREAASRADAVIAVSAFTGRQVVELLNVDAARVYVVHHGLRPLPYRMDLPRENVVLNVGAIQTRKNIARLVEAFETLDASWRLVLAGGFGYGSGEIRAHIERSTARERISVLGYIGTDEHAAWY